MLSPYRFNSQATGAMTSGKALLVTNIVPGGKVTVAGTRDFANSDNGQILVYSGGGNINLTLTAGLVNDFGCTIVQAGAGTIYILGSGVSLHNDASLFATAGQYAVIGIVNIALNSYVTVGDLA